MHPLLVWLLLFAVTVAFCVVIPTIAEWRESHKLLEKEIWGDED